ncbi:hypothetical protein [Secundilactobacillus silagei]|uniref:hypothetical protein n=1 Tax=Secundilactobacillus silagei TaxID=1293415 RepID=UPI0006D1EABA|nr:hypothetical protein [Secundilactobacillus silagei]
MKKIGTKLLVVLAVALGGVAASQEPTTAKASTTFSSIPSGHFQSSKAHYAFHWQTMKSGKNKGQVLVFGNFDKPSVQLGVPNKYKLSKNHRTLTTYYRLMSSKGKLEKTTYRMDVYKYSSSKYRVKLNQYKAGLLPSSKVQPIHLTLLKSHPLRIMRQNIPSLNFLTQNISQHMMQTISQTMKQTINQHIMHILTR